MNITKKEREANELRNAGYSDVQAYLETHPDKAKDKKRNAERNAWIFFKKLDEKIEQLPLEKQLPFYGITDKRVIQKVNELMDAKSEVYQQGQLVGEKKDNSTQIKATELAAKIKGWTSDNSTKAESETQDNELRVFFDNENDDK